MGVSLPVLGVPGPLDAGGSLDEFLLSLAPTIFLLFDETAGNLLNYGSDGNSATVSGALQNQTGPGGLAAYSFDGAGAADDYCIFSTADIAGTIALTTQRWAFLVYADSLGENNQGGFAVYDGGASTANNLRFLSLNRLSWLVGAVTTDMLASSNTNQVLDILDTWAWVFADYDHDGTRKGRLWKGFNGTVTAITLAGEAAADGALNGASGYDLYIGNSSIGSITFDGLFARGFIGAGLWSVGEMKQIVTLSGV